MAHLLGGEQLHLEFPAKVVFDGVTVGVNDGDRIGIVGRNGDGKSSLLRMLARRIDPDDGRVTYRSGVRVGYLDQGDQLDGEQRVSEAVVGEVAEHLWASNPTIRAVIAGLLGDIEWDARIDTLSGGQRRRVALAVLLTGEWDVLMLDEPTNHLDLEGVQWLAEHVKQRWPRGQGGLLVVTHDRWFLDEVSTQTWEVHDGVIDAYEGGYAAYVLQRVERDRQAATAEQKRTNLLRKELAWLRRGAPARTAKPKFRIDAANQLIADVPPIRNQVELAKLAMTRMGKEVVFLDHVSVQFGDREVLHEVEWRLGPGDRIGILGVNGAGKSTLLSLIAGSLQPSTGRVKQGKTVKIATLTQQFELLDEVRDERVSAVVARRKSAYSVGDKQLTPGQLLERLGFTSAQLSTPVRDLSGGQKRRLQLLLILLDEPNVLILDEPTNDMDTDMLAAIEDLLDSWPGTLIVVSHDRYLLERVTDQQYALIGGRLRHLPGGVDQYLKLAHGVQGVQKPATTAETAASAAGQAAQQTRPALDGAQRRAYEKECSAIERKLERLGGQLQDLLARMAEHNQSDYVGLTDLNAQVQGIQNETAELERRWDQLAELLG